MYYRELGTYIGISEIQTEADGRIPYGWCMHALKKKPRSNYVYFPFVLRCLLGLHMFTFLKPSSTSNKTLWYSGKPNCGGRRLV